MIIRLRQGDPRPIYVQIMDEVRRAIVVGSVQPHDPLPSLRQLAGDLRVNPNTVQLAYRELEREGLIYTRRGQGTFVAERSVPDEGRERLARDVAARALRDAYRHGLGLDDLIEGLRAEAERGGDEPGAQQEESPDAAMGTSRRAAGAREAPGSRTREGDARGSDT